MPLPKLPLKLLKWFCKPGYHKDIEGDLLELYERRKKVLGLKKAKWHLFKDILLLFRPGIIRSFKTSQKRNHIAMLRHNFIISFRNFKRDKTTFLINLLGLSSGLTCALLIFLWVQDELQMDKFHEKDDQLYQVMQKRHMPNGVKVVEWSTGPLAHALKDEMPEIEYAASTKLAPPWFDGILTYDDHHLRATPQYVDKDFFDIFSYPLLHGNKNQALSDKYAVIISEEMALKLFHSTEDAIGKTIEWTKKVGEIVDFSGFFTISGVFKNVHHNSSEHFDLIFTYEFFSEKTPSVNDWNNDQASTHLILRKGSDINALDKKITDLVQLKRGRKNNEFFLKKYSTKYLYGNYENGIQAGGRIDYVWLFSAIALLILLIASINFMNLSTAKASTRIKEIGVKKTLGASRNKLIFQFMNESLLISFLALLMATAFVALFLPQFNYITGKHLKFDFNSNLLAFFLGITFITGLVSSTYPALYLSGFNPIQVLKGKLNVSFGELWIRKGLVVFQFAISLILIVSVLVIYNQITFIHTKNLGYNRDNILSFKKDGSLGEKLESFLSEVRALPQVIHATNSDGPLVNSNSWTTNISWEGKAPDESLLVNVFITNYDFIETFGIRLKEGRTFSPEFGTESSKVILNEAAVKSMGLIDPIGKTIHFWREDVEIIGVIKDFQFKSLYNNVGPCIFGFFKKNDNYGDHMWIKIKAGHEADAIERIANIYDKFNPGYPFEFTFMDDGYQALYDSENKVATLSKYFAGLAILISCLGLFGLVSFNAERRMKEIGIRKILGSSVLGIVRMLTGDFTKTIITSIFISIPISYLIAKTWLDSFAYRIDLEWWFFAGAGLLVLIIAWLTIGMQTIKAARVNPVECLKDE